MIQKTCMVMVLSLVLLTGAAGAQDALTVEEMTFCEGVESRQPLGIAERFPDTVGRVYCYTRITGADGGAGVVHVWYFDGREKARLNLDVKSESWRTWSSKKIVKYWTGEWRVEVLSSEGDLLDSKTFTIDPAVE